MKIGFIGLGNRGSGMALNLVKAKHDVHIYDLNKDIRLKTEMLSLLCCPKARM